MSAYRRVLRFHNFRYLFLGQAASFIGDQVVIVALALFVTQFTGSPTDLGLVFGVQAVPLVLLLLFGGVWADRLPRHRIMIATDLTRAVLHATLALLIFTGAVRIWQVIVIEALFGAAEAFFRPAYTGLIPQTVPEELINDANSLTHAVDNLSLLVGPAIATALVVGVGPGEAFAFDAATFVLSALLLMRVRPRRRGEREPSASVLHELRVGWREVSERAWVWVTIVVFSGALFCALAPWIVLGPTIAREVYGATSVFGVLSAMVGAGALAGSLTAVRWRPRRPLASRAAVDARMAAIRLRLRARRAALDPRADGDRDGRRLGADGRLVGDSSGPAHPASRAFARQLLRLDGIARAASARLRPGGTAGLVAGGPDRARRGRRDRLGAGRRCAGAARDT